MKNGMGKLFLSGFNLLDGVVNFITAKAPILGICCYGQCLLNQ